MIQPLLISQKTEHYIDDFMCVGIFEHAINLQNNEQTLLTLHRYNKGLSPFGWLFKSYDFDALRNSMAIGDRVVLSPHYARYKDILIHRQARKIQLTVEALDLQPSPHLSLSSSLIQPISHLNGDTGLFGSLKQIISKPLSGELLSIQQTYISWLQHKTPQWESFIGKGMGLTPSHDDTLIGMLLSSFFDIRAKEAILPNKLSSFIPQTTLAKLPQLTTYVSVAYYQSALTGHFSLPLLRLVKALHSADINKIHQSMHTVMQLGHTSGCDTLLGMWLAIDALDKIYNN